MTTQNIISITVPAAIKKVNKYAELMNVDVQDVAALASVKWTSKPKKADALSTLEQMEKMYTARKALINKIVRYEGGTADITMTVSQLNQELTTLQSEEEDEMIVSTPAPKMYTEDEVKALLTQVAEQTAKAVSEQAVTQVEEKIQLPELQESEVQQPEEVSPVEKKALIKKLQEELAKLDKLKDRYIVFNTKKYYEVVDQYRAVEEHLLAIKGEDVKTLIANKYNGLTRTAAKGLYNAADVTEEYGHKGIDRSTELLNSVLESVVGVTKDAVVMAERTGKAAIDVTGQIGHAGVDLTAGTFRATGDFIQPKKK